MIQSVELPATLRTYSTLAKPFMPVVFFLSGVAYDTLTLSRIDRLLDNLILLLYLSLLGVLVVLTGRMQLGMIPHASQESSWTVLHGIQWARPHFTKALQFLLGGLFSAYTIFYFQSASFTTSSIFLGLIILLLIANEWSRHRLSSLKLLVCLYTMVVFSFFTFFLPVLTGWMNTWVFLLGGIVSVLIIWKIIRLIFVDAELSSPWEPVWTFLPALGLILILNGLYFLNWIPPVPLSLKNGGMYEHVEKKQNAYHLTFQKGAWYQFGKQSDDRVSTDRPIYCFTSVFAPVALQTTIYHHWQHRPQGSEAAFLTTDRIPITISGGREHGYRSYTWKQRLDPGEWRVDVETEDGRIIGRIDVLAASMIDERGETRTIVH
ncbi:MAG: DUF2914 domain-containing protein [Nitrospirales bacterium]|nr:DUF2914 domain-containing protein [Nitrospira sp.]MDR4500952.1 DUF2914 domain-containing protein [Nitrospirales bacterium]